jgi:hypothetical protein
MSDVIFLAIIVAFFALAVLFVRLCDRIIGSDEEALAGAPQAAPEEEAVAA